MELISVVVVTYNSSKTVLETLDSIYEQTYKNVELVVTDDFSTDNTLDVVRNWLLEHEIRFKNVQIIQSKSNQGVAQNCNRGILAAKGEYIQIIAGDDLLFPNSLERKIKFSKENDADFFISKVEMFGDNQKLINDMNRFCDRGYDIILDGYDRQKEEIAIDNYVAGPSGSFYKKQFWLESGGYDLRFPMLEDYPFLFKYIYSGNKLVLCDEVLGRYRIANSSLCHGSSPAFNRSYKEFFYEERLPALVEMGRRDVIESQVEKILIDDKTDDFAQGKLRKFESYYMLLSKWLMLSQNNKNLGEWFEKYNYRNIAIYGMGEIGERLIAELEDQKVKIAFGIDQKKMKQVHGIPTYTLKEKLPLADVIVVTVPNYYDEIKEKIQKYTSIKVISIQQVVSELE